MLLNVCIYNIYTTELSLLFYPLKRVICGLDTEHLISRYNNRQRLSYRKNYTVKVFIPVVTVYYLRVAE
jgi:hypothetical protein